MEILNFLSSTLLLVVFFPLLGAVVLLFINREQKDLIRWLAVVFSLATFALSLVMLAQFDARVPGEQLTVVVPWIQVGSSWNINFHLGLDGMSILLVLLTTLLTPIAIFSSWTAIQERVKEYMIFFLMLETGMLGVFLSLDLFLFYIFWEFTLVPMYF